MSLHSHHYTVSINVHLLLQIRLSSTGTDLEASRQRFPLDEGGVRARCIEQSRVAVEPQRDPIAVVVAGLFPDSLHPVHHFPGQSLLLQSVIQIRIEGSDERPITR